MSTEYDHFGFEKFKQVFEENVENLVENAQNSIWAVLIFVTPDQEPKKTVILSDKQNVDDKAEMFNYTIGRSKSCDIRVNGPTVSNRHCTIYKINNPQDEMVFIEDMSSNGTYVNNEKINKNKPWRLYDEDVVRISKRQDSEAEEPSESTEFLVQIIKEKQKSDKPFTKNYYLGKTLGKGAFAEVNLAFNRMNGASFAVKIIDTARINEHKRLLSNFDVEKSILGRAKHPSIIRIHAIYHELSCFYVVLDLAKGGELFDRIVEQGHFTENETRIVMLQLLLGINYLHLQGIVHRDIKPENILLSDYEGLKVQLADFGLAKIVGEQSFMKTLCGTPMYVAPEVIKSRGNYVYSNKVDMWSLGVVLYICLYGFPPFSDDLSPPPLNQQILQGLYTFPEQNANIVSKDAKQLVSLMLTVDPTQRISAKEALAHPWLRAYKDGSSWKIRGIDDFSFAEHNFFSEEESTQSMSRTNSSPLDSQVLSNLAAEHITDASYFTSQPNPLLKPANFASQIENGCITTTHNTKYTCNSVPIAKLEQLNDFKATDSLELQSYFQNHPSNDDINENENDSDEQVGANLILSSSFSDVHPLAIEEMDNHQNRSKLIPTKKSSCYVSSSDGELDMKHKKTTNTKNPTKNGIRDTITHNYTKNNIRDCPSLDIVDNSQIFSPYFTKTVKLPKLDSSIPKISGGGVNPNSSSIPDILSKNKHNHVLISSIKISDKSSNYSDSLNSVQKKRKM